MPELDHGDPELVALTLDMEASVRELEADKAREGIPTGDASLDQDDDEEPEGTDP